jgi:beta-alanine--pyruvate transaminase
MPDLITTPRAHQRHVPMGACSSKESIYDAFMQGPTASSSSTATPIPAIRSPALRVIGTLETYEDESSAHARPVARKYWEEAAHSLKGTRHVIDIRNCGLVAAVELEPRPGAPGRRAYRGVREGLRDGGFDPGDADIIALSPPSSSKSRRSIGCSRRSARSSPRRPEVD